MKTLDRQKLLLTRANKNSFVSIPDMAQELHVSVETIRRDINVLCQGNLLKKVHGGAVPVKSPLWKDVAYSARIHRNQQGKFAVAAEAAKMIPDGSVVSFDGGATTEVLASCIRNVHGVTFVVNSLPIATILVDKINAKEISGTVIMVGGQINSPGYRSYTPLALDTLDKYSFNVVFLTCTALSSSGASNSTTNPGVYAQHLMHHASVSVLIADSEKLGKNSVFEYAKLTEFDHIITDDLNPCPSDIKQALENINTKLTVVSCKA